MSSFRTARVGRSGDLAGLDQDHIGYGAAASEQPPPDVHKRAPARLNRQAGPDAARIRKCIEQLYARQSVLDESGASRAILPVAVTPERGAFIADLCRAERPAATLEVGMAWGLSTLHILAALAEVHGASGFQPHVVMDPFEASRFGNAALRLIRELGAEQMVEFYPEPSEMVLPRLLAERRQFDLAFIDGDHRFDPGFVDLFFIHRLLKPGGVVIFDDVMFDGIYLTSRWAETNLGYQPVAQYPLSDQSARRRVTGSERARIAAWRKPLHEVERDRFHFVPFFEEFVAPKYLPNSGARRAERNRLSHAGLIALRAGDRQGARRLFAEARKLDPFRVSTYLRWIRSFLPARLAAMLSRRTRG